MHPNQKSQNQNPEAWNKIVGSHGPKHPPDNEMSTIFSAALNLRGVSVRASEDLGTATTLAEFSEAADPCNAMVGGDFLDSTGG